MNVVAQDEKKKKKRHPFPEFNSLPAAHESIFRRPPICSTIVARSTPESCKLPTTLVYFILFSHCSLSPQVTAMCVRNVFTTVHIMKILGDKRFQNYVVAVFGAAHKFTIKHVTYYCSYTGTRDAAERLFGHKPSRHATMYRRMYTFPGNRRRPRYHYIWRRAIKNENILAVFYWVRAVLMLSSPLLQKQIVFAVYCSRGFVPNSTYRQRLGRKNGAFELIS